MNKVRRLLQLLNFRRTVRLELDTERLMASSLRLAQSAASLAGVRAQAGHLDAPRVMAVIEDINSNLLTIQHYLDTGQVHQAKILLDALLLVTRRSGTNG